MNLGKTNLSMRAQLFIATFLTKVCAAAEPEVTREMSTDRPDTTESAYTVPAGLFQVEMSVLDFSRESSSGVKEEAWILGQVNFKVGLDQQTDLQMIFDTYTSARTRSGPTVEREDGFGDVALRLKRNIWGNDGGKTALAIMPYVSIPTGTALSRGVWEGGLILPLAVEISPRVGLGLMAEADIVQDDARGSYDIEWLTSATLGFGLSDRLGAFVEVVGIASDQRDFQALFDAGVTFALTDTFILDAGVRLGMNRHAPDLGLFTGLSFRF